MCAAVGVDLAYAEGLTWGQLFSVLEEIALLSHKPEKQAVSGAEMYQKFIKD